MDLRLTLFVVTFLLAVGAWLAFARALRGTTLSELMARSDELDGDGSAPDEGTPDSPGDAA